MIARVLIVAYGNPLRCDDGIAWRAADELERKFPDLEIRRLHQLAPEVAESVRHRDLVVFIDAACVERGRPGDVRVREVSGQEILQRPAAHFTHTCSPVRVLELARELYKAHPKTFVITVAGENFGHGDCLSEPVAAALPELIARIERLVEDSKANARTTKRTRRPRSGQAS
ncbi:MAG TPA: hydrogenase maturation protease [Candidatus Sulfotelmatobacter sp.]|nr:hydrogenase maturation protease [Candidatus Sulfotelmatobacter sp.]